MDIPVDTDNSCAGCFPVSEQTSPWRLCREGPELEGKEDVGGTTCSSPPFPHKESTQMLGGSNSRWPGVSTRGVLTLRPVVGSVRAHSRVLQLQGTLWSVSVRCRPRQGRAALLPRDSILIGDLLVRDRTYYLLDQYYTSRLSRRLGSCSDTT